MKRVIFFFHFSARKFKFKEKKNVIEWNNVNKLPLKTKVKYQYTNIHDHHRWWMMNASFIYRMSMFLWRQPFWGLFRYKRNHRLYSDSLIDESHVLHCLKIFNVYTILFLLASFEEGRKKDITKKRHPIDEFRQSMTGIIIIMTMITVEMSIICREPEKRDNNQNANPWLCMLCYAKMPNRIRIQKMYYFYLLWIITKIIIPNLIFSRPLYCLLLILLSSNRQQNHNFRLCIV